MHTAWLLFALKLTFKRQSKRGCRYSILLKLPYFDAPRMLIVDPMHRVFLGSAKYFLKSILVNHKIITESDFSIIQDHVDSVVVPSDIGRIQSIQGLYQVAIHLLLLTSGRIGQYITHLLHYEVS